MGHSGEFAQETFVAFPRRLEPPRIGFHLMQDEVVFQIMAQPVGYASIGMREFHQSGIRDDSRSICSLGIGSPLMSRFLKDVIP